MLERILLGLLPGAIIAGALAAAWGWHLWLAPLPIISALLFVLLTSPACSSEDD